MTAITLQQAMNNVYESLKNDNHDIDAHIVHLKAAMQAEGRKEIEFDHARLAQNNRQGRKMMQSYFKKRGVAVSFSA